MKVIILGSGSSVGVPVVGCKCEVCLSKNPKNKRTRASLYIEQGDTSLLVDTSPDLRFQTLKNKINKVDAVLYTHSHADHINGIDDVKPFNIKAEKPIPAYGDKETIDYLKSSFAYVFRDNVPGKGWYKPWLQGREIGFYEEFSFGGIHIKTFEQKHGKMSVMGYRFGDMAYTTDANFIDEKAFEVLAGVKLWVVDCLKYDHAESHATFDQTMRWIERVKPNKAVLTHMAHDLDWEKLNKTLPKGIKAGFDGMKLKV